MRAASGVMMMPSGSLGEVTGEPGSSVSSGWASLVGVDLVGRLALGIQEPAVGRNGDSRAEPADVDGLERFRSPPPVTAKVARVPGTAGLRVPLVTYTKRPSGDTATPRGLVPPEGTDAGEVEGTVRAHGKGRDLAGSLNRRIEGATIGRRRQLERVPVGLYLAKLDQRPGHPDAVAQHPVCIGVRDVHEPAVGRGDQAKRPGPAGTGFASGLRAPV